MYVRTYKYAETEREKKTNLRLELLLLLFMIVTMCCVFIISRGSLKHICIMDTLIERQARLPKQLRINYAHFKSPFSI